MAVALRLNELSKAGYNNYIDRVRTRCPRGIGFFCDGTPNPIPQGEYKSIGKCEHYKKGRCRFFQTNA